MIDARHCKAGCAAMDAKRIALVAQLDAFSVEAAEAKRREVAEDRHIEQVDRSIAVRDSARDDPVTARLARQMGVTAVKVDLLLALVFAAVLEGLACLCWYVALSARTALATSTTAAVEEFAPTVTESQAAVAEGHECAHEPVVQHDTNATPDSTVARLRRDIAAGLLRPTVKEIRRHLRCGQATATTLRQQFEALKKSPDTLLSS
ncbi:hypothetical protein [Paraburkholderia elongata]|uniref:Uncharacterized protein n=1 Tax=Paraburkholderia elongata TaxID=2675747 RepID=A0A972SI91_9BURK|nr:hypothetical protein [Paraburkholderia elongata]NPT56728.1 hypothetical protein [Paraburkholderia elongata]